MSNIENYEAKLAVITAIPEDQIIVPGNIPVDIYIHEAETLFRWCQEDQTDLTARGMDWTLVEDLPVRCGALMEAESRWKSQRYIRKEAGDRWALDSDTAYDLRNKIVHEFHFAYRKDARLSGRVKEIASGSSHADMLQDLNDLAVLGKENPDPLTAINFDMTLLDIAAQMADEKGDLYAQASVERVGYKEAKKIRDQAYTHLKEAVDEIRDCGQFVYWRNTARVQGYRSDYTAKRNKPKPPENEEEDNGRNDSDTTPPPDADENNA
jgi:hypothetical protein